MPDANDYGDYRNLEGHEHLTMVDHMRAQMQPPGNQMEYLKNQALQRKAEYERAQRAQRSGQGQ